MRVILRLPFSSLPVELYFSKINLIPTVLLVMLPLVPVGDSLFLPLQGAWDVWKQFTLMFGALSPEAIGGTVGLICCVDWVYSVFHRSPRRFLQTVDDHERYPDCVP